MGKGKAPKYRANWPYHRGALPINIKQGHNANIIMNLSISSACGIGEKGMVLAPKYSLRVEGIFGLLLLLS
jgi:hypothetical protein